MDLKQMLAFPLASPLQQLQYHLEVVRVWLVLVQVVWRVSFLMFLVTVAIVSCTKKQKRCKICFLVICPIFDNLDCKIILSLFWWELFIVVINNIIKYSQHPYKSSCTFIERITGADPVSEERKGGAGSFGISR